MATKKEKDGIEAIKELMRSGGATEDAITLLSHTIENVVYMKIKLDDTRKLMKKDDVVVPYDNGGGQTGIRENPIFKGYENLFKSYMAGLKLIIDAMPKQPSEKMIDDSISKPPTVLELMREKHKREA